METKICSKCGKEKSVKEFRKCFYKTSGKSYYKSICKSCEREYNKQSNKKCAEYKKKYYEDHKDCIIERAKKWRKNNIERAREIDRQFYRRHKEKMAEKDRLYLENNREKVYAKNERWRKANLSKKNAVGMRRNAKKLNQTPSNADKKIIMSIYQIANEMTEEHGIEYQVDHIKPLSKGGLHHESNLQILSRSLNSKKANRWPLTKEEKLLYAGVTVEDLKREGD